MATPTPQQLEEISKYVVTNLKLDAYRPTIKTFTTDGKSKLATMVRDKILQNNPDEHRAYLLSGEIVNLKGGRKSKRSRRTRRTRRTRRSRRR